MNMRYSGLQVALLLMLIDAGRDLSLDEIEKSVYRKAHKKKPKSAKQAAAALVRSTSGKIELLKASIERKTPLGSGNKAVYALKGRIDLVKTSLEAYI